MDYSALTTTVRTLNEAVDNAIKVDSDKQLTKSEEWIWHMITLAKVTTFFEQVLSDFDEYYSVTGNDR